MFAVSSLDWYRAQSARGICVLEAHWTMTLTYIVGDVGKYKSVAGDCVVQRVQYSKDMVVVVIRHGVSSRAMENKTDLAVFSPDAFGKIKDRAPSMSCEDFAKSAEWIAVEVGNRSLAELLGAGAWQELFGTSCPRLVFSDGESADVFLGKVVKGGQMPALADDGSISFVTADWVVEWSEEHEQYYMSATDAAGTRVITPTMGADVVRGFFPTALAVNVPDVTFDASDYPLAAGILAAAKGETESVELASFSARAAIDAGETAGIPLPAGASSGQATNAELRRFARLVLGQLEDWLDAASFDAERVEEVDTPAKLSQILRRLGHTQGYSGQTGGFQSPPLPVPSRPPQAEPQAPPQHDRSSRLDARGVPSAPRWNALKKRASNDEEWTQFEEDALVWAVPDNAQQRAVIGSHERTRAGAIERWLAKAGPSADPALLAGAGDMDAGDLLSLCLDCIQASGGSKAGSSSAPPQPTTDRRVRVTVRSDHGGETVSEQEQQERAALQADVCALEDSAAACAKLEAWAQLAAADTDQSREQLQVDVSAEPDGALKRLVSGSVQVNSVTVDAEPLRVHQLAAVRGVLDNALLRAVFGAKASSLGDVVLRAIRAVRTHKFARVRLMHLLDKADGGTDADPLLAFSKLNPDEAIRDLAEAMQRLQAAWAFAEPSHTGQVIQFVSALQQQLLDSIHKGVGWPTLSTFYAKVVRRVDRKAGTSSGLSVCRHEPPKASWCYDAAHPWVMDLNEAKSIAVARRQLQGELDGVATQLQEAREESAKALLAAQARSPAPAPKVKGFKSRKRKGGGDGDTVKKAAKNGPPTPPPNQGNRQKSLEEKKKELLEELGEKDGKPPCWYHHRARNGCRFSAGQCTAGYH
jgi:hypothetical protein